MRRLWSKTRKGAIITTGEGDYLMPSKYVFIPEDARKFTKEEGWFKDASGRYVLFRGVNFGSRSKMPPYLPVYPLEAKNFSKQTFLEELKDVSGLLMQLKHLGFNVVRLVVQWKAIAPTPSTIASKRYLDAVKTIVQTLFKLGIYSLIDFHQDIASERYGGDGFPDWAILYPPSPPVDVKPCTGWQARYGWLSWPPMVSGKVRNTLQSFWKDETKNGCDVFHTQSMFVESIRATAAAFKGLPGVLGYEPFNEPDPVGIKGYVFEQDYLGPFYENVINQIDASDKGAFVFIEPRVDWTVFKRPSQIETYLPQSFPGNKTVFSFHYYDSCTAFLADAFKRAGNMSRKPELWSRIFEKTLHAAKQRDLIPFLTE
jgi:endoglycosylceramidase